MYAVVKRPVPELRAFTFCMWLRPTEGGIGTPLSYAVPDQPNELVLLQGLHTPTELLVDDKVLPHSRFQRGQTFRTFVKAVNVIRYYVQTPPNLQGLRI